MKKITIGLSIVVFAIMLPLVGCGSKEQSATEVSQQQPLKQKIEELIQKAKAGDAEAETELGEIYASGEGLPKDASKAANLFQQAAEKGIAKAQFHLGQMYSRGEGVPQDSARAADLVKQSAVNGYAKAQTLLASMYAKGEGVTRDEVLAYVWSSLAVSGGDQDAKQLQESVTLNTLLHEEAERLKSKWTRGVEIVREQQKADVPAPAKNK